MVSRTTPQTVWGSMITGAGKALKYTVYGTLTVGLALFGIDTAAHLTDEITASFNGLENTNLANGFKDAVYAGWGYIESGLSSIFGYDPANMDGSIEKWTHDVHEAIGGVIGFLFDHKTEVGVGAAGAVGGGILTAASMKQSHADRIQQERMKLAAAEAFQRG